MRFFVTNVKTISLSLTTRVSIVTIIISLLQVVVVHLQQHKIDYTSRLPLEWRRNPNIAAADKIWIGQKVFSCKQGELVQHLKLWWYPPEVSYTITSPPDAGTYFCRRLF